MKDKIKAYHKISQAIHSSKNELHLQTCSVMIGVFSMRFDDESIEALLKDAMDCKHQEILGRRMREAQFIC
ncbi:MAG TPA: hypothetical protein VGC65_04005 [Bacteroidia bacterium]|jgi:hypothetical protein